MPGIATRSRVGPLDRSEYLPERRLPRTLRPREPRGSPRIARWIQGGRWVPRRWEETVRSRCVLGIALALPGVLAAPARALTLHHTYRFEPARLELVDTGAGKALRASGLPRTWELGQPEIPYDVVTLLVPQGSRLVGLRARDV